MIAAYHGSLAAVYASLLLDVWTRDNCSSCCSVLLSTSRVSVLVWNHHQRRQLASCVYKAIDICARDSAFLSVAHSHQSAPTLLIWAITGSTATVDYFWGVSVPNSNEISHHIQKLPYASCDAPSTSGTHFLVICLSLMAAQSHAASR